MQIPAPTILLIEKDEVTLELYQRELSKSFTVLAVTEIPPVMELLASAAQAVQAVVIEPEIGSGQGWELIDCIQRAFPDRRLPVIVCTTRDPCGANLGLQAAQYLTKPVLPQKLREKTLEAIRSKDPR
jgi:CheY-like chemotaxis protein